MSAGAIRQACSYLRSSNIGNRLRDQTARSLSREVAFPNSILRSAPRRCLPADSRAMASTKAMPEHWLSPAAMAEQQQPRLKVYNSLTRTKTDFIPRDPNLVKLYNCGPTVYDDSHMGHARNYVTQDIIRRILRDYFGYNVHAVMNITDIDDKIIVRARQTYLFEQFRDGPKSEDLAATIEEAWQAYFAANMAKHAPASSQPFSSEQWAAYEADLRADNDSALNALKEKDPKAGMHYTALSSASKALQKLKENPSSQSEAIDQSQAVLAPYLDARYGSDVSDNAIFRRLPAEMEEKFVKDMADLRVEPPVTLTRVTEYVPEIVAFVEQIVQNGYAYAAGSSVYFNVGKFEGSRGSRQQTANGETPSEVSDWHHVYAKLQPWNKGDTSLIEEGEGALSANTGKRSATDFALWKGSKPGEPSWDSPWGKGRPGWHIECSVMASEILGSNMDVHAGGIDLAFPHHDNELAQSEAYHDCRQWVNYFLHSGHLHIEGLKMSKSLKNFITIQEALQKHSARQLRLAFLLQPWHARMDYRESGMAEVKARESLFNNFFANVHALVNKIANEGRQLSGEHNYNKPEKELTAALHQAQISTHIALCDSFDTPKAMDAIAHLVTQANTYINAGFQIKNTSALESVAVWVTRMLCMFGLGEGARSRPVEIGWGALAASSTNGAVDRSVILQPYLDAMSKFRDAVRKAGRGNAEVLALCDKLRDEDLVELGVALDDQPDGTALVKLVPREDLLQARREKQAAAEAKAAKAEEKKLLAAEQARKKEADAARELELGRTPPKEYFRLQTDKFSAFDDDGFPTADLEGQPLAKSAQKRHKKELDVQIKRHEKFLKSQSASP